MKDLEAFDSPESIHLFVSLLDDSIVTKTKSYCAGNVSTEDFKSFCNELFKAKQEALEQLVEFGIKGRNWHKGE